MARHGVTTALDMATWSQSTIEAIRGLSGVTDFRTAGKAASAPGSVSITILASCAIEARVFCFTSVFIDAAF